MLLTLLYVPIVVGTAARYRVPRDDVMIVLLMMLKMVANVFCAWLLLFIWLLAKIILLQTLLYVPVVPAAR